MFNFIIPNIQVKSFLRSLRPLGRQPRYPTAGSGALGWPVNSLRQFRKDPGDIHHTQREER